MPVGSKQRYRHRECVGSEQSVMEEEAVVSTQSRTIRETC
jgi:hypothetical protein